MNEKLKEYVGLFGGWLSAVLLFFGSLGIAFDWFTTESIDAFIVVLMASVPFLLIMYGVWKNSYRISKKAKKQDAELKRRGLK